MSTIARLIIAKFCLLVLSLPLLAWPQSVYADTPLAALPGSTQTLTTTTVLTASQSAAEKAPPTYVKGLYLTYHAVGHEGLRTHAFDLIENTELNAVVIDIKGDLGVLT